ncbi:MAG: helix-turn-helix domain-containing protein [Thermoguttaceae bacterium]
MTKLLTHNEVSELLQLTPRQVIRLAKRGDFPCVRFPRDEIRFDPDDIRKWVDAHKRPAQEVCKE